MSIDINKAILRKAAKQDERQIKAIAGEVGLRNYAPFLGELNVNDYMSSGMLGKDIEEHLSDTVVCELEEQIVGACAFWDDLVHLLIVRFELQGNGIGKMLLEYVEEQMFEGNAVIRLKTFEDNLPTIAFYEKNGWKIVGKEYSESISGHYLKIEKHK